MSLRRYRGCESGYSGTCRSSRHKHNVGFLELLETAGKQRACQNFRQRNRKTRVKTAEFPYIFNGAANPVKIKLDIVFLLHSLHNCFQNHLVSYVLREFDTNYLPCPSKCSTYHPFSIRSSDITNDLSIYLKDIQDELC